MSLPQLPAWIPPANTRASRNSLMQTARSQREQRVMLTAASASIRIAYGVVRGAPQIFTVRNHASRWVFGCLWSAGPNTSEPVLYNGSEPLPMVIDRKHYLGAADQGVDPWLAAAIPGYADTLVLNHVGQSLPMSYSVLRVPTGHRLRLEGQWAGRAVYNPVSDTVEFSTNPALWLADWLSSPVYGLGRTVDYEASLPAIEANDVLLGGEPRRWGGLLIDRRSPAKDWIETLRTYAGCLVVPGRNGLKLVPNRPRPVSRHVPAEQVIGSLNIQRTPRAERPTVVRVRYTDTSVNPWQDADAVAYAPGVEAGLRPWRESVIPLPGIQSHRVAYREAVERLNSATLTDLHVSWLSTDEALADEEGDVITLSHPDGLEQQPLRLTRMALEQPGRWRVFAESYNAAVFSNVVVDKPDSLNTPLPDPRTPPEAVTGLMANEEVYQSQSGIYATRFRIRWDASTSPYVIGYRVDIRAAQELMYRIETRQLEAVTGTLQELVSYDIEVFAVTELVSGEAAGVTLIAQGKYLPPGDVPQLTAQRIAADTVHLNWQAAVDVDIWRYEIRKGGTDWESATLVDRTDALALDVPGLSVGQHVFRVKAIDSVGLYSLSAATAQIQLPQPLAPSRLDGFEVGGEVRLSWPASESQYVQHYEVRYAPPSQWSWESAKVLDRVDALRLVSRDVPAGHYRFSVRAIDRAGNLSSNGPHRDIEVTLDDRAYLADRYAFEMPSVANMASWQNGDRTVFITDSGESWGQRFPQSMASYTMPICAYQNSPASHWQTEVHDIGTEVSGNWQAELDAQAVLGTIQRHMAVSHDGVTFDNEPLSVKRSGQFVSLRAEAAAGSVLRVELPHAEVRVDAIVREETGIATTANSGATTVTLDNPYAFVRSIKLTPIATEPRQAVVDNIITGSETMFDIWLFNNQGEQVSGPVNWSFKGV